MRTINGLQIFTQQLTNSGQLDARYTTLNSEQTVTGAKTFHNLRINNIYKPVAVNAPGYSGQMTFDQDFIYVCISGDGSTGLWRGAPLLNWSEI